MKAAKPTTAVKGVKAVKLPTLKVKRSTDYMGKLRDKYRISRGRVKP